MEHDQGDSKAGLTDELLAIRCQLGEADAFTELAARWHPPLLRYLRRMTNNDEADDLVQEVWLRVFRAMPGLRDPARLRPWLFSIARRTIMDRLRREYAAPVSVPVDQINLATESPDDLTEDLLDMHDALGRLPPLEREVLILFYLRELSLGQLAELLSIPAGTVKSRLHRARRLLRHQLSDRGTQP